MIRVKKWIILAAVWTPVILWMGVIYWLSDQPRLVSSVHPLLSQTISVFGHLIFYAVYYVFVRFALRRTVGWRSSALHLTSLLVVLCYGLLDEYHQSFVPGRDPSGLDVTLDLLGGLLADRLFNSSSGGRI